MGKHRTKRSPEQVANWRKSMQKHWDAKDIDRSRCGLPRNKPEDVWKKIDIRGPDECWPYMAAKDRGGYGVFRVPGLHCKAHRVVYSLVCEPMNLSAPKDVYEKGFVLHKCDNRSCCNPAHLYLGNIFDNMRDKVERNRCYRGGSMKKGE